MKMLVENLSCCGVTALRTRAVTGAEMVVKMADEVKPVGF